MRSASPLSPDGSNVLAMSTLASRPNRRPTSPGGRRGGPRSLTRDEVMTATEVAELLHLPLSTVYGLARRGQLPAIRLGRTWRFLRPRLEELLNGVER